MRHILFLPFLLSLLVALCACSQPKATDNDVLESFLEEPTAVVGPVQESPEKTKVVNYELGECSPQNELHEVYIRLDLPETWSSSDDASVLGEHDFHFEYGVAFWPSDNPDLCLGIGWSRQPIGICATGALISERAFDNGYLATEYIEESDGLWYLLIYDKSPGCFSVECLR